VQVGDLVKAMIITGHPRGIITRIEQTQRWGALHYVHLFDDLTPGQYRKTCLRAHQLEAVSESR
jgi:hypothetical protein